MTTGGVGDLVAATEGPARILVDGSVVEVFAGGRATTSRVYPTVDSGWQLEGSPTDIRVWRLALPSPPSGNWALTAADTPSATS
jgi:hypothetical protein